MRYSWLKKATSVVFLARKSHFLSLKSTEESQFSTVNTRKYAENRLNLHCSNWGNSWRDACLTVLAAIVLYGQKTWNHAKKPNWNRTKIWKLSFAKWEENRQKKKNLALVCKQMQTIDWTWDIVGFSGKSSDLRPKIDLKFQIFPLKIACRREICWKIQRVIYAGNSDFLREKPSNFGWKLTFYGQKRWKIWFFPLKMSKMKLPGEQCTWRVLQNWRCSRKKVSDDTKLTLDTASSSFWGRKSTIFG